jgi:hypothetical protein
MNATKTQATYEVNANGNRHYASNVAANVADVAAEWAKQGHAPKAFAIFTEPQIRCVEVPVTNKRETKAALIAAE